ncbi:MAG: polysaccharide biosynthesis/export family protein [Planctomycetaceae bacterium]
MHVRCPGQVCLFAFFCVFAGCAQNQFRATELPQRYSARPVRDYSTADLAQYSTATEQNDTIAPGDRLTVHLDTGTLTKDSQHIWKVSVDEAGQTNLPNIGPVRLAGMTQTEAETAIVQTSLQRDVFLTPVVDVALEERKERTILLTGAVKEPGPVKIYTDEVSLADAIVRAGGLTSEASGVISVSAGTSPRSQEQIDGNGIRSVSQSTLQAVTVSLDRTPESELGEIIVPAGAVVNVEPMPPRIVQVMGVIGNKAVEAPKGQNLYLLDALTMAGGQRYSNWISDRVTVTRSLGGNEPPVRIKTSIRGAQRDSKKNVLLAPGDIVTVEENALTFTLSTLSGFLGAGFNASRIALP